MLFAGIGLRTPDVRRLADFYKRILQTVSDGDDDIHQEILTQGAALAIQKADGTPCNRNATLVFTVDDVDADYRRLQACGVPVLDPPTTRPWGARNMRFSDPDGNEVVFRSFPAVP